MQHVPGHTWPAPEQALHWAVVPAQLVPARASRHSQQPLAWREQAGAAQGEKQDRPPWPEVVREWEHPACPALEAASARFAPAGEAAGKLTLAEKLKLARPELPVQAGAGAQGLLLGLASLPSAFEF